jgi:hypothetical protein
VAGKRAQTQGKKTLHESERQCIWYGKKVRSSDGAFQQQTMPTHYRNSCLVGGCSDRFKSQRSSPAPLLNQSKHPEESSNSPGSETNHG